jgi:phage tail-like protein
VAIVRERPYSNNNFLVDLGDGVTDGPEQGFLEVTLPEASVDVVEYRSGNEKESGRRKITALAKYSNVTLKRGVIGSLNLYHWWNEVRNGNQNTQRTVTVQVLNEDRSQVVMIFKLLRARPVKYTAGPLNAASSDVLIESIELAVEGLEVE